MPFAGLMTHQQCNDSNILSDVPRIRRENFPEKKENIPVFDRDEMPD